MLNVNQTRVQQFESEILPLTSFVSATGIKSLSEATDTFFDAFRTLGVGELYARQSERQVQLKSLAELAAYSKAMFKKYNDQGISRVLDAMAKLKGVSKEMGQTIKPADVKGVTEKLQEQINEFKLQCTDLEVKGRDVEKLFKGIDEVFASFKKGGYDAVLELTGKKMKELIEVRKGADRGAVDNFPVWKVIAIIIGLGIWIVAFIHCGIFGCSVRAGTAYAIIFAIAAIVSKFC